MLTKDSAANPFSVEAQFNAYVLLANTTLQRVSELVELNLALGRDTVRESADARKRLLAAADAKQYTALSALLARESLERGLGYARDFVHIVTRTYLPGLEATSVSGIKTASKAA